MPNSLANLANTSTSCPGIPTALGVHGGTGAIFAVVKAHPYWYSPLFPVVFIVSALVSGGGLILFLQTYVCFKEKCSGESKEMLTQPVARLVAVLVVASRYEVPVEVAGESPAVEQKGGTSAVPRDQLQEAG